MQFHEAVSSGFKNYINFSGRATRSEFWYWTLFVSIVLILIAILEASFFVATISDDGAHPTGQVSFYGTPITSIWALGTFLPGLAVAVRRLHDTDRRGWWYLIGLIPLVGSIILIVFYCLEGTSGENRFGPNPLEKNEGENT